MALDPRPTRSPSTLTAYPARARTLVNRCRKQLGLHPHEALDYRRLVGWLIEQRQGLSMASWRQYKAAIAHFLEGAAKDNPVAEEALAALLDASSSVCAKRGSRTSGNKLKRFPVRDYRRLIEYLDAHQSPWSNAVKDILGSGLLAGLRPVEWGSATFEQAGGEEVLVVRNAKATNSRAHGPFRHILLGGLSDDERDLLHRQVKRASAFQAAGDYPHYARGCGGTLARAARTLWPHRTRYPTLYSTRHQFSADAKASGMSTEEVAALLGHAVDTTAIKHYGRKTAGVDLVRVRPSPEDVARVRRVYAQSQIEPTPTLRPGGPKPTPPGESGKA